MALRKPTPEELPEISALCLRSKAYWPYDDAFIEACRDELTLAPSALTDTELRVLEGADGLVGMVQVSVDGAEAELLKLYVDPSAIGQGHGQRLFDWAVAMVSKSGAASMVIEADPNAEPFYRKMGAEPAGRAPSGSIPGRFLPRLELRLREAV